MERVTSLDQAKSIMGCSFIGPDELGACREFRVQLPFSIPPIRFSPEELLNKNKEYLLILGVSNLEDGSPLTIRSLLGLFGNDPYRSEPCFYNQDWYLKEDFLDKVLPGEWFLIRKSVYEDSRAVIPDELEQKYLFPLAIRCVYAFFTAWLCLNKRLWWHDFVWCADHDHNGDRIYVGKYHDVDGVNKNGFSIHRHLALRKCYGAID